MQWIKEVEMAKSIVDLTSQSITGRRDFPDCEMLDAKIASALKKIITSVHFRRRVSVEEQRAQTYDRFLQGRQIAYMICEHFRATGACEAVQGPSDLFNIRSQNDNVQDFDVRWDQALLSAGETPTEMDFGGLYKSKLQDSVQLQTVMALSDQEIVRNNGQPSYPRMKTSVRLHVDQTMRTRNFRVQNEKKWRGAVTKSQRGKNAYVERKVGECCQWRVIEQCSKGCSFSHDPASGNRRVQRQE